MRAPRTLSFLWIALAVGLRCAPALAQWTELPRSVAASALAEAVPTAFTPVEFTTEDFTVDRLSGDATIEAQIERDSLRWVRVGSHLVVPRALLVVRAQAARGGVVSYEGFTHPLTPEAAGVVSEVPVVLVSGADTIRVQARAGSVVRAAEFAIRFAPRGAQRGRVLFDSNCSPFGLHVAAGSAPADSWLYIGCRMVRTGREHGASATLELYTFWERAGAVAVDGVPIAPAVNSIWTVRVAPSPGRVRLSARGHSLVLGYGLPQPLHAGFVGLGLGPYYYTFRDGAVALDGMLPLLTLYAGYAFTPDTRLVYFNATAMHSRWGSIDQGLYVWLEQAKLVDDRVSLNLLLGANVLIYSHDAHAVARVSAPQGFEFIVRDLFARNRSLTLGAFLYPKISGREYYNVWLRWGSPQLFGELNYIEWQEPHGEQRTSSRAFGVSFGTPLLRFF